MGTQSIPTRANAKTIDENWFNIFKQVLTQTFVPRNATGDATDVGGDLGSTTYRWATSYLQKIILGAIASGLSIEESSGKVLIKISTASYLEIGPTSARFVVSGLEVLVADTTQFYYKLSGVTKILVNSNGISRASLASVGQQISSSSGTFSTSSTSAVDVTNLSVTITTVGRPVFLGLMPATSSSSLIQIGNFGAAASPAQPSGTVHFLRDATGIGSFNCRHSHTQTSGDTTVSIINFPAGPWTVDVVTAGTYTYKVQALVSNAAYSLQVSGWKLVAFEIA